MDHLGSHLKLVPPEFQGIIESLPQAQRESLEYSLQKISAQHGNKYVLLFNAIIETIKVFKEPDPLLFLVVGKVGFFTAQYRRLIQLWEEYERPVSLHPFIARIYAFQNKFPEGKEIVYDAKNEFLPDDGDTTLLDTLFRYETLFTEGLLVIYAREFPELDNVLQELEYLGRVYKYKRVLRGVNSIDYVSYEYVLQILSAFYNGNTSLFFELLDRVSSWINEVKDHWIRGFYFNLRGISYYMKQEAKKGEEYMRMAMKEYQLIHDLRGYSIVGANLGTGIILEGRKKEGREVMLDVLDSLVELGNYPMALSYMLTISKSYLDENDFKKAREYLEEAEKLRVETDLRDPASLALFTFLYARLEDLRYARQYLDLLRALIGLKTEEKQELGFTTLTEVELYELEVKKNVDVYTKLWYLTAEGAYAIAAGNLTLAQRILEVGIKQADKTQHFDTSLELSIFLLEIYLKNYLLSQQSKYIYQAINLANDLMPLIMKSEDAYFIGVFHILMTYMYLAVNDAESISNYLLFLRNNITEKESEQGKEYILLAQRIDDLNLLEEKNEDFSLSTQLLERWLNKEFLAIMFVMEAMRLLKNLQFQHSSLGQKLQETDDKPLQLMLVEVNGITIYSYNFDVGQEGRGDEEQLIGGFLSAINAFTQEMFGTGSLKKIEQENSILLIERLSEEIIAVLRVQAESYHVRKQFKAFIDELQSLQLSDYISSGINLNEDDPFWEIIDGIVKDKFNLDG